VTALENENKEKALNSKTKRQIRYNGHIAGKGDEMDASTNYRFASKIKSLRKASEGGEI